MWCWGLATPPRSRLEPPAQPGSAPEQPAPLPDRLGGSSLCWGPGGPVGPISGVWVTKWLLHLQLPWGPGGLAVGEQSRMPVPFEGGGGEMTRLETQVKGQVSGKRALEDGDTWAGSGGGADAPPLGSFPGPGAVPWRRWAGPPLPGSSSGPRADVTTGPDYRRACPAQRLCNAVLGFFVSWFFFFPP